MGAAVEANSVRCRKCGTEASRFDSRCPGCGALTGLLQAGQHFYWRRFLLKECLWTSADQLAWLVRDVIENRECILLENVGAGELSLQQQRDFVRQAAPSGSPPDTREPNLFAFTFRGRPFLVKDRAAPKTLKDVAAESGGSEEKAASVFFGLLRLLEGMHGQNPPQLLGPVSLEDIIVTGEGAFHVRSLRAPDPQQDFRNGASEDMRTVARLACMLLPGGSSGPENGAGSLLRRAEAVRDPGFAAALEWLTSDLPAPDHAGRVFEFAGHVFLGWQLMQSRVWDQARPCLEAAARMAATPRVKQLLREIESGKTLWHEEGSKPSSPGNSQQYAASASDGSVKPEPAAAASASQAAPSQRRQEPKAGSTDSFFARGACKVCPQCGTTYEPDRLFCELDGSRLQELAGPTGKSAPAPEAAPPPRPATPPFNLPAEAPHLGRRKWVIAACAAVLAVFFLWYRSGAPEREFLGLMEAGQLVSSNGRSAYALYQDLVKERGNGDSLVRELGERVRPKLDQLSESKFSQWRQSSDIQPLTWEEMTQLEEWRSLLVASAESRARLAYARGMAALSNKDPSAAEKWFQEALVHKPGWALALNGLGRAAFHLADFARAERYYQEALAADPSWSFPHVNLANLYRDVLRRPEDAEAHYFRAIQIQPDRGSFYFALANFYWSRGLALRPKACQQYREALARLGSGSLTQGEADLARRRVATYCQ